MKPPLELNCWKEDPMLKETLFPMLLALVFDQLLADPLWLPHPVVGFGKLISFLEKRLNQKSLSPGRLQIRGLLVVLLLVLTGVLPCLLLMKLTSGWLKFILMSLIFWMALSLKTLTKEAQGIARPVVDGDLLKSQKQVSRIVGRDTSVLSLSGVIKACIESVAESASDGVVAPYFWGLLLGPAGAMGYKAINTMDSMIAYRNERFENFGKAAAIVDDLANLIPARLTALISILASFRVEASALHTFQVYWKNRRRHNSPNAGHPESCYAGALGVRLAGPATYEGVEDRSKPTINPNGREVAPKDIDRSIRLLNTSIKILVVLTFFLLFVTGGEPWIPSL